MQEQEFLRQLVKYPKETAQAEYKRAVLFKEKDDFSAKLVRHILGHANAGGGYLIIGFEEDNKNRLIPEQVTNDICASYEVTRLSQYLERYISVDDELPVNVHKIDEHSSTYPVISVPSFLKQPIFCLKSYESPTTGEFILRQGSLYIRSPQAKTVIVAGLKEWNQLIEQCVKMRQDDLIERVGELFDQYGIHFKREVQPIKEANMKNQLLEQIRSEVLRDLRDESE